MDSNGVLRTTKIGGGFVKEDVLSYIDSLNSEKYALEEQVEDLKKKLESGGGATDAQVAQFESEMTRLRGELGTTKNQLRAAQEELNNRPVLGGDGSDNGEAMQKLQEELSQAQQAKAALEGELQGVQERAQQWETERAALQGELEQAKAQAQAGGNNEELTAQFQDLQAKLTASEAELAAVRVDLQSKEQQLLEQSQQAVSSQEDLQKIADLEAKVQQLEQEATQRSAAEGDQAAQFQAQLTEKDTKIAELEDQIAELKEESGDDSMDMSALFAEAQASVKKMKSDARKQADQRINDANAQAESILSEANNKAERIISEATEQAAQTIQTADTEAEQKLNDADAKAIQTVADAEESVRVSLEDAEKRTKTTTETARTIRALLHSEIDSVSKKFNEISLILENLTSQANSRLDEAKSVITEARDTVGETDDLPTFESFEEVANQSFHDVDKNKAKEEKSGDFNAVFDELSQSEDAASDGWN